jgi:putative ABC transport system permease protein
MSEQLSGFKNASGVFVKVIGIFALLAFIIGSIGVMNMTLIYVGERTNEIGIRKAIGAEEGKIGFQFLSEVVIVSFAGTLIGIIAGIFIGVVMFFMLTKGSPDIFGGARLIIPWEAALSTALLSLLLSLVAGIFPAVKAIRMTITDALRK